MILRWRDQVDKGRREREISDASAPGKNRQQLFLGHRNNRDVVATDPFSFPSSSFADPFSFLSLKNKPLTLGKDATEDFEEIGHSVAANEMLARYKIGSLKGGDGGKAARKQAASAVTTGAAGGAGSSGAMKALQVLLPLLAVIAALLLPKLLAK